MSKYDFILLSETWSANYSEYQIPGYDEYASHRAVISKNARRLSGGVILYVKRKISPGVQLVKNSTSEVIWVKLDRHFFGFRSDLLLCLCYVTPVNSSFQGNIDFDIFSQIVLDMSDFHDLYSNPMYFICGDMNSRTCTLTDYIENDSTRHIPLPDDYIRDSPMQPRANMDTVVNSQGKSLIELCRMCNIRILNGRVRSDKGIGHYTCFTYNGMSCVDYVLCSPVLMPFIHDFDVLECTPYSDHCPIYVSILVDSHCRQREQEPTISLSGIMIKSTPTVKTWLTLVGLNSRI